MRHRDHACRERQPILTDGLSHHDPDGLATAQGFGRPFARYGNAVVVRDAAGRVLLNDRGSIAGEAIMAPSSPLGRHRAAGTVFVLGRGAATATRSFWTSGLPPAAASRIFDPAERCRHRQRACSPPTAARWRAAWRPPSRSPSRRCSACHRRAGASSSALIVVIARSGSDEAIQMTRQPLWIASLTLAMTKRKIVLAARSTPSPRVRGEGWDEGALPLGAAQRPRPLTRSLQLATLGSCPRAGFLPRAAEVKNQAARRQTNSFSRRFHAPELCFTTTLQKIFAPRRERSAERRMPTIARASGASHLRHSSAFGRQRALSGRARSGALLRHSRGRTHPPLAQLQFPRFLRPDLTGVTRFDLSQVYRAPRRPVVLPVQRSPGAARERMANPPAGTAPAPPFRHAFRKGVLNERGGGYVTEMGTDVKSESLSLLQAGWQEIISAIAIIPQKGPSLLSRLRSKSPATFGDPSNHSPSGDTIGGESSMRDALIIGALYAALGAVVAALAVKLAAPSTPMGYRAVGRRRAGTWVYCVALVVRFTSSDWEAVLVTGGLYQLRTVPHCIWNIWHFSKDRSITNIYSTRSIFATQKT